MTSKKKTESAQLPFTCKFSIELRRITYNTIRLFDTDTHMSYVFMTSSIQYTLSLSSSGFISVDAGGFQSVPAQPASSAFGSYRVFIIKVTKSPEHRAQLRIIILNNIIIISRPVIVRRPPRFARRLSHARHFAQSIETNI